MNTNNAKQKVIDPNIPACALDFYGDLINVLVYPANDMDRILQGKNVAEEVREYLINLQVKRGAGMPRSGATKCGTCNGYETVTLILSNGRSSPQRFLLPQVL